MFYVFLFEDLFFSTLRFAARADRVSESKLQSMEISSLIFSLTGFGKCPFFKSEAKQK